MKGVDLRRYPFRGILKEMSEETGIDVSIIHKALFKRKTPNPELAALFNRKLQVRNREIKKFKRSIRQVV
ncbi:MULTISPECIES: hypothetical protein [unclassified Prosthecochloris]|nr:MULTISPECIES: hypothetical protein [unclassified Prosthecochloris]UZJ37355.1 hypothetical protein OO005_11470 [Prosthecochloris sp. SCSIO W1103]UZJ39176.1 hypothetical protein OO185_04380 [Prosthecochloris sp. SCSIO W1102]UZJ41144.1 hypothetical protein OO006_12465 [Prosthecochloris sp. SCSIO W1101]